MPGPAERLAPDQVFRRCDPDRFDFETTDELDGDLELVGQPRAAAALSFGVGIEDDGYNLFALGPSGTGKRTFIDGFLRKHAEGRDAPSDICYLHNFEEANKPVALRLEPGRARRLREDMNRLVSELASALPAAFEGEEYQARRNAIDEEYKERSSERLEKVHEQAKERDVAMLQTPVGFMFAPIRDGEVLDAEAFGTLDEDEKKRVQADIEELQRELQKVLRETPRWERERQARQRELSRETARLAIGHMTSELRERWSEASGVLAHLDAVEQDLIEHAPQLLAAQRQDGEDRRSASAPLHLDDSPLLRRYHVNVLVDNGDADSAPVVLEDHPTMQNLVGRIEHLAQMGTLVTDFTLIRSGALHRANGGYLVLDALAVLRQPYAWEALKRALRSRRLQPEAPGQAYGLISTVTLEPEPLPLDLKVVLLGDRLLYYLLSAYDPDFLELFKVAVDFDDEVDRDEDNQAGYARLVAAMARRHGFRPFHRTAVARVIERASRIVGDGEKLSARTTAIADLLREANYWAEAEGHDVVGADDVDRAIGAHIHRLDRIRARLLESTLRELVDIDTEGTAVGQINGLSVVQLGDFAFGRPSRITASVRLGKGEVVDIEREVELGGPVHSKGVLILAGFLGARFAREQPLSLTASLVFEQSYGGVEGDSASSAELYALLSAIAEVPLSQARAVTGSVNQHGRVQAIGGVNEKIEGFFDLCAARGLTGEQGVLIPAANVAHLMLRRDVVEAVEADRFHVWPIETVDQGVELLTGLPLGRRDEDGAYPADTLGARVQARMAEFTETMRALAGHAGAGA